MGMPVGKCARDTYHVKEPTILSGSCQKISKQISKVSSDSYTLAAAQSSDLTIAVASSFLLRT